MNKHPSRIEHTNEISGFSEGEGSEIQLEMENRIRNLLWTVSGDYAQEMKPDISYTGVPDRWPFMMGSSREHLQNFMIKNIWGFIC